MTTPDYVTREEFDSFVAQTNSRLNALEGHPDSVPPTVSLSAPTNVTKNGATFSGIVNPGNAATTWGLFVVGQSTDFAHGSLSADTADHPVSGTLTGLSPNTQYSIVLQAVNSNGAVSTAPVVFTTLSEPTTPPTVTKTATIAWTDTGVVPNKVEYQGSSWTPCGGCPPVPHRYGYAANDKVVFHFHGCQLKVYGPNDYDGASAATVLVDGVTSTRKVNAFIASPGARSEILLFDTGVLGNGANVDHTVTIVVPSASNSVIDISRADVYTGTPGTGGGGTVPTVTAIAPTNIGTTGATLRGTVNPGNQAASYHFEWRKTGSPDALTTPVGTLPAGGTAVDVSATVTGLQAGTGYDYGLVASNASGDASPSNVVTFQTQTSSGGGTGTLSRITRSGTQLLRGGSPYKFAGLNWDYVIGCGEPGEQPNRARADAFFSKVNPFSMTRIWALPGMDLSNLEMVIASAEANNQYLNITLFNPSGNCTNYIPDTNSSTLSDSTKTWISAVVNISKKPVVAMYECANEADENGNIGGWYDAVGAYVKSINPDVLVGSGGGNNSNDPNAIAAWGSATHLDGLSYHGYYPDRGSVEGRARAFDQAAGMVNKFAYVGERGFCCGGGGQGRPVAENGSFLTAEYRAYLTAANRPVNFAGYFYWDYKEVQLEETTASPGNALFQAACDWRF